MADDGVDGLSDDEVIERARAHGVATRYTDWRDRETEVPPATLRAVVAALGPPPAGERDGWTVPPVVTCRVGGSGEATVSGIEVDGPVEVIVEIGDPPPAPPPGPDVVAGRAVPHELDPRADSRPTPPPSTTPDAAPQGPDSRPNARSAVPPGDANGAPDGGTAAVWEESGSRSAVPPGGGAVVAGGAVPHELDSRADARPGAVGRGRAHGVWQSESGAHGHVTVPGDLPVGWHRIRLRRGGREESAALVAAPARLPDVPPAWGLTTQLYSVRSRESWGLGDLRDLAELARWGAGRGAGFVLINPLHAAEPLPPITASPYSPLSRRFPSPLYLRVEDVPENGDVGDRAERLGETCRNVTADPLDRDAAWKAKRMALESLFRVPRDDAREAAFRAFRERQGRELEDFATWAALAEEHGADWRTWPADLRSADAPGVPAARERLAARVTYHAWLQWLLDDQLTAAQRAARDAGMPIGILHDLAVGVRSGSADEWTHPEVFAAGMSVGAPPDAFNQQGQDWGQPPWHPARLAEAEYGPYRAMLRAVLRQGGGLRLDHAMQLSRLWWVPEGASPADGTYVTYDREVLLAILTTEAELAGAVIVGEDLGTVEPGFREDLADRAVLGTSLLWFERDERGPKPPGQWRERSLATVGTHDMPPIIGFLHGDHLALRDRLGLLTRPLDRELAEHRAEIAEWIGLLNAEGLLATDPGTILAALADGSGAYDEEITLALHAFLGRTPARLLGVALPDAVGERRTQNQPGTVDEYPNWRVALGRADGTPVALEDLNDDPLAAQVLDLVARARPAG
ncbi:4-alpha-glucanotransferase [Actinomadura flavalba]|uniref:4-alpha-glucanotransferase n=1 Tax=Actinomadura flavalba TaxID=1120938 RepID=UPI0003A6BFB0|nr:4-alpha-glucanotransferase [Actinomadura flavalba]